MKTEVDAAGGDGIMSVGLARRRKGAEIGILRILMQPSIGCYPYRMMANAFEGGRRLHTLSADPFEMFISSHQ